MAHYEGTRLIKASATNVFAFLSRVDNLPSYFPRITDAQPAGEEAVNVTAVIDPPGEDARTVQAEAWFRVDHERLQIEWGSEGPNDYRGDLEVTEEGDDSRVSLSLHTEAHHPGVHDGLEETLDTIKGLVESGSDSLRD
ncbi:MAG: SRPBCC family protein [Propionibacteriales bacterium]|nr:SRPBCC family protein [Propionibacteriales bacterium]